MARSKPGIVLAQLGTPDAPTSEALRRYLQEFLSDPRVVEVNRLLWWCILNGFILPFRPRRSAALYRRVWTKDGSPLLLTSQEQARLLEEELGGGIPVEVGMRYGSPSIASAMDALRVAGVDRVLILPMFPQYSGATTGSVVDAVGAYCRTQRVVPALRFVPSYYRHPGYVGSVATVIREHLERLERQPEKVLISFHGIPKRYVDNGDPYRRQAEETFRLLTADLGFERDRWELCFQSRFGRQEWLKPYTDVRFRELGAAGVQRIAVVCPGFTADCLETIDEIGHEGKKQFVEAGGEELYRIPCVNAHPAWIRALGTIAREELAGWLV